MENFSLCFFCAGTKLAPALHGDARLWRAAADAETELRRNVRLSTGGLRERRDHPCYRDGLGSRLRWRSTKCTDARGVPQILVDEAGNVASSADRYWDIRVAEPWRVPQVIGQLPQFPTQLSAAAARGEYSSLRCCSSARGANLVPR